MRPSPSTIAREPLRPDVRLPVDRRDDVRARLEPVLGEDLRASRAIGASAKQASAMTSPTTSMRPGTPSARSVSATARRDRGAARLRRPRPGVLLRHRQVAAAQAPPRRARPGRVIARRLGARARRVRVTEDERPVGLFLLERAAIAGRIAVGVGGVEVEAVARLRQPELRVEDADSSGSQCWPVWSPTSSMPASRSAAPTGPDLMNCGRLPTTERTFTTARLQWPAARGR